MTASDALPDDLRDLLERPLYGALGTVRPDGGVQVNPMWFEYDGEHLRFTHTSQRAKYRNLQSNPSMSLAVFDPDEPNRYVEVRGRLVEAQPDPTGAFYVRLQQRYGSTSTEPPADREVRVVLVMTTERFIRH